MKTGPNASIEEKAERQLMELNEILIKNAKAARAEQKMNRD